MRIKRLLEIPKERVFKKIIGYDEIYTIAMRNIENNEWLFRSNGGTFKCIPYSKKFWYADPISFSWEGKNYLFAEAYDRRTNRGHIVVAEIKRNFENISFQTIIKEDYHMSFPMVFEWDGSVYMIPETSQNKSINLYYAVDFPYVWTLKFSFIIDYELVDTVVIEKEEKLVLLASEINPNNPLEVRYRKYTLEKNNGYYLNEENYEYDIYFNLSDRNAGRIFKHEDVNILPTQRSTKYDYGVFLEFKKIEGDTYSTIKEIGPSNIKTREIASSNIIGIHTYSKTEKIEIIDLRYLKFSPVTQWRKWINLLIR